MKEHKKLYKSGKLWMTATIMAFAAGATLATTNVAHAAADNDNQTSTQTTTDQLAQQQKKVNDDQAAVDQATNDVNGTKSDLADAKQN